MAGQTYSEGVPPPVIVISDEDRRGKEALKFLGESGFKTDRPIRLRDLSSDRIVSPLWVDLATTSPDAVDDWFSDVGGALAETPATFVIAPELLDLAVTRLEGPHVELLIDPDAAERATAAGLMRARMSPVVRDINKAGDNAQLRQLSQEVARIAETLAKLTASSDAGTTPEATQKPAGDAPAISAETVRQAIRARRLREEYFDPELFADPAWDMLLDLLSAEIAQIRVPVSSLCIAASVPPTTALRWMKTLTDRDIFRRVPDPHDGRRVFIELAPQSSLAMRHYFEALQGRMAA